ncbi:hypothetical protein DPMN_154722 [Dreissena polymorpha]|uniref:Uncharacterized protein n=1 Tax=Dreissena polymorpha TaxID=45954 RepID=A0A9D4JA75_DREPO|nr:hypothetical protein DPMN_154722 [Dreissena polymorpha]
MQQGMTLYDPRERRTISAANRYEMQHNQSLIFSCEPSDVFYFEPNRRMFECVKGSWVAKKRSHVDTWDFGNNGSFPECRRVVCPADYCKFGGHCIQDHVCECPEQTSGKQCETPLCNPDCQNGGTCVSPDRCQCPEGFDGRRCENDTKPPLEASTSANKCTAIANGQITDRGKSFTCNTDYKPAFTNGMDVILYTRYSCTCNQTSGKLQCKGTEVACTPIGCQIPAHVQQGMTLYDPRERRTISAANRYEMQHNQSLIFSCEPSDVFYFEPNRRMFECVKGSWVAKKRSHVDTWDFGNNGSFPECRRVVCPADYCKFGGHCIQDHVCECPEQTSGKQCETPLCNPDCQNGGTCVSPDRCQCPEGFDGRRCENESWSGWIRHECDDKNSLMKCRLIVSASLCYFTMYTEICCNSCQRFFNGE